MFCFLESLLICERRVNICLCITKKNLQTMFDTFWYFSAINHSSHYIDICRPTKGAVLLVIRSSVASYQNYHRPSKNVNYEEFSLFSEVFFIVTDDVFSGLLKFQMI